MVANASKPQVRAARRATNVSLDTKLVESARELGVNVSRACEAGLSEAVRQEHARRWSEENRDAIDKHNAWVERHGMILADLQALEL